MSFDGCARSNSQLFIVVETLNFFYLHRLTYERIMSISSSSILTWILTIISSKFFVQDKIWAFQTWKRHSFSCLLLTVWLWLNGQLFIKDSQQLTLMQTPPPRRRHGSDPIDFLLYVIRMTGVDMHWIWGHFEITLFSWHTYEVTIYWRTY